MAKGKDPLVKYNIYNKKNINEKNMSDSIAIKHNRNFNSYLAGLFEGDGHIWFPNKNMKKKHNPRFCITFNLKDEPLAKKLLEIIGYGFIRYKPKNNACVLVVSPVKGLKKIIDCINGELRTPKIIQINNLIDWIKKNHYSNIIKLPLKKGNLGKDNWLSGFIDADGSFSILYTKLENNNKKIKISCRLRIEQRMFEPISGNSYFNVFKEITDFLNCNLKTRKQISTSKEYYTFTASSHKSLSIILTYFSNFSLYSSKYLDYKDWEKAVNLILNNEYYTEKGILEIESLKSNMNLKRTYFNWFHLNELNLYI
jgi:LAGLIDADG endonuclease